jgi:hypothetical protein
MCRQRRGLLPILVVSSLVLLVLIIIVMRAAVSARGDERGLICFLSKLGVQIGGGCSSRVPIAASKSAMQQALGELVEHTPRVKDVEPRIPTGSSVSGAVGVDSSKVGGDTPGLRRLMWMLH